MIDFCSRGSVMDQSQISTSVEECELAFPSCGGVTCVCVRDLGVSHISVAGAVDSGEQRRSAQQGCRMRLTYPGHDSAIEAWQLGVVIGNLFFDNPGKQEQR